MSQYAKHEIVFITSLIFLIFFSFFMIKKTLPIKFYSMIDFVKEKKFLLHLIVLLIIISIITIKIFYMYKKGEKETESYTRITHSLKVSIIAFIIAFFAKFDLVFVPFYFIFIVSFFMASI